MKRADLHTLIIVVGLAIPVSLAAQTPQVQVTGALHNVMWNNALDATVRLDTMQNMQGLAALGPAAGLQGEIMVLDGVSYYARVSSDSSVFVQQTTAAGAPFLVYTQVHKWKKIALPDSVTNMHALEHYLDAAYNNTSEAFAFKLSGIADTFDIHVFNLPKGASVYSPADAHKGQVNFVQTDMQVDVLGFFSRNHQGVFTHKGSFTHLHLISGDKTWMGHVDGLVFSPGKMELYIGE